MSEKQRYRMTVSYRGTHYNGWQSQPGGDAVQDVIEKHLRGLHQDQTIRINACSRTDRGVHARGLVGSYLAVPSPFVADDDLCVVLNRKLPRDIVVKELRVIDGPFRPQRDAKGKSYTYVIQGGAFRPFLSDLAVSQPSCTRVDQIRQALALLEGTHDFSAFTVNADRPENCTRTIYSAQLDTFGEYLCLTFTGSSFLYRMVRRLAGALIEVGCGRREPEWITEQLVGRADPEEIKTAPPHGLYLMQVYYDQIPAEFCLQDCPFLMR